MGNFKRDNKNSGRDFNRGSGRGKRFSGGDDHKPEMHKATCAKCGVSCEVPFRPTGGRPVLCSDCFKNQGGGSDKPNRFGNKRRERSNFVDKQMYDAVCDKCGKDCQVPFKPTAGKPVFCSDCFKQSGGGKSERGGSENSKEIIEQINLLSVKIDKLIETLTPKVSIKKTKKPEAKKEETKAKAKIKTKAKAKTKAKVVKKKSAAKKKKKGR